ncbi:hypothetical protein EDC30_1056 [Paucimonas lemoignei]|uniref:Uncharacterized protein n=1 Tax=Paucimonas lemoignei TaxID=29443 RepID=A0A4R3HU89_PAULE|nr:hypothetical protein EDC30_1056 [Paucimonas lemoignei]
MLLCGAAYGQAQEAYARLFVIGLLRTDGGTDGIVRKPALLKKPHSFCPLGGIRWRTVIFTCQNGPCPLCLVFTQLLTNLGNRFVFNSMTLQLRQNALIPEAGGTAVHQGFGKTLLRKKLGGFQRVEHRFHVLAFLGMTSQLTSEFKPAMLPHGQIS